MLNRTFLFGAMLATVSGLTTPAFAAVVYTHDAGVWHMIGDVEPDTSDSACIFETSLATAHVQINIFPKTGIPDHVTMTLADPKGTWRPRQTIAVRTLFLGDNVDVTPFFLAATANNNEKITFRDLPLNFLSNFGHANSITLFREDPKETFIDLTGTSELLKGLEDCKASLINPPGDTNVTIPANPVAQSARSPDVVAAKPVETQQPVRTESLIQSPQPAAPSSGVVASGMKANDYLNEFMYAVEHRDDASVRKFIAAGKPGVNDRLDDFTALMWAVDMDDCSCSYHAPTPMITKMLIDAGADVNAVHDGETVLNFATGVLLKTDIEHYLGPAFQVIQMLVDARATSNATDFVNSARYPAAFQIVLKSNHIDKFEGPVATAALVNAGLSANLETIKTLIKSGAKLDGVEVVDAAVASYRPGKSEIVMALLAAGAKLSNPLAHGLTLLGEAARYNDIPLVKALIASKVDVNQSNDNGEMVLQLAAGTVVTKEDKQADATVVTLLIKAGARVDDRIEGTALWRAAGHNNSAIVAALIKAGAPLDVPSNVGRFIRGQTPLKASLDDVPEDRKCETMKILAEAGANPNVTETDGDAVILSAVYKCDADAVRLLISKKADLTVRYKDVGVMEAARADLVPMLFDAGAKAQANILAKRFSNDDTDGEDGELETLPVFLAHGADVNADFAATGPPLFSAAFYGKPRLAKALIAAGANINWRVKENNASLLDAAMAGKSRRKTPEDIANSQAVIDVLKAAGEPQFQPQPEPQFQSQPRLSAADALRAQVDCGKFHYDDEEKITTDNALAACTRAINENAKDDQAYATRANIFLKKNNLDGALSDFNQYILLKPKNADGYSGRAEVYHRKGNLDKAIADVSRYIEISDADSKEIDPNDKGFPLGYSQRAELYEAKGDRDHAIADYKKVLELDPIDQEAFQKLKSYGIKIIEAPNGWGMEVYKEPKFQ